MTTGCTCLVLATGNAHKVQELRRLLAPLNIPLQSLSEFPLLFPASEDGQTVQENAVQKAVWYARQLGKWVLTDDTGLQVDALDGAPGVRSSRYAGPEATMEQNRAQLLARLSDVPWPQRTARFVCHLVVADPAGQIVAQAEGYCAGRVRSEPSDGAHGFGYDVLFEPEDGGGLTLAELAPQVTDQIGHRGRAAGQLCRGWGFQRFQPQ